MDCIYSIDQLKVINSRNQNVLVSAAAGSGKTSVLTERIVEIVADKEKKIDIDRILVVTFTNAAAREMKERIAAKLNDKLLSDPENEHLRKQAQLIYNAQITTIDSYCLYILKNYFHRIGVDPAFRVASEGEMKLLKADVVKEVIKRAYETRDPLFHHVVDCYSQKDDDGTLEDSILNLYTFSMSHPNPLKWLNDCRERYRFENIGEFKKSFYVEKMIENITKTAADIEKDFAAAVEITEDPCGVPGYKKITSSDEAFLKPFFEAVADRDYDRMMKAASLADFIKFTASKKGASEEALAELKVYRDRYKDTFLKIKKDYLSQPLEDVFSDSRDIGKVIGKLIDLVIDFMNSFSAAKRERSVIDFTDMEHLAIEILIDRFNDDGSYEISDVARNLRDYYAEVMVDEYQDSNLVQEILIKSVSREESESGKNRFMVGDVKQSIYRFRLARPDIFIEKTEKYSKEEDNPNRIITLKQNYRSRDSVIDSVNAIFEDIMTPDRGGIDYDEDARLTRAGSFSEDTEEHMTEVLLLDAGKLKKSDFCPYETDAVALRIKELVSNEFKVTDKKTGTLRPVEYRDFAVLFRAPSSWRKYIKDSFEKIGVPYHMEGVGNFYDTREIRDIMAFLKVIDNPLDDISLYSAMTSCFGNMTDEECVLIKAFDSGQHYYLWDKLKAYDKANDNPKVKAFLDIVLRYRKYVTYMPISEFITTLVDESGYRYIVSALPDGKQRLANVNLLILKASEYAKTSFHGLFHFMRYVELIKKTEQEEGEANIFDENANVVKVMSIHKSKGLEFPVCIVAGVESEFNDSDYSKAFVYDIDYGIGAKHIDPVRRTKRNTLIHKVIEERLRRENLGEEIRVLYVALTRAKEKLIIVGSTKKAAEWLEGKPENRETSYLGLIGGSVLKNKDKYFKLTISDLAEVEIEKTVEEIDRQLLKKELEMSASKAGNEEYEKLLERFSFRYPYENLAGLYTKTSVSELKLAHIEMDAEAAHPFEENEPKEFVPAFAGGETAVKGTQRGTAYHNMLQLLNYSVMLTADSLSEEYERQKADVLAKRKMTADDVSVINSGKIVSFLESDLAHRMGKAENEGKLYKEQPFVMGIPANELDDKFPGEETVLIQGVIDAFFIEDGEIVLLDYKTDRVDSAGELISRYKTQLDYYAMALSKITGLKVKEKLIYSLRLNESIIL